MILPGKRDGKKEQIRNIIEEKISTSTQRQRSQMNGRRRKKKTESDREEDASSVNKPKRQSTVSNKALGERDGKKGQKRRLRLLDDTKVPFSLFRTMRGDTVVRNILGQVNPNEIDYFVCLALETQTFDEYLYFEYKDHEVVQTKKFLVKDIKAIDEMRNKNVNSKSYRFLLSLPASDEVTHFFLMFDPKHLGFIWYLKLECHVDS